MKEFHLTAIELQDLRVAHKSAKSKSGNINLVYKLNVIILLGSEWEITEVVEALLLDDETIRSYVKKYQEGGVDKLIDTNYKGSSPVLSESQLESLCTELDSQVYLSSKDVCHYVHEKFDVKYSISGITHLLRRVGYVYKKPKLIPATPNLEAQEEFLEYYNEFMQNKAPTDAVFFADAVHPVHNSMPAYGWIKKGQKHLLKSNSGRGRLNIHGAMNAETYETAIITSEYSVNTDSTIALLEHLEELYPLAVVIYVILDNAKYHFSKKVQEWLKNSRVKLVFLPTYSPELNLIERLWKVFKKNVLYNTYYPDYAEFKKASIDFFKNQQQYHEEITSIMGNGLEDVSLMPA